MPPANVALQREVTTPAAQGDVADNIPVNHEQSTAPANAQTPQTSKGRASRRSRTTTQRAEAAANQALQVQVVRVAAKDKQTRWREARIQNANLAATVEQVDDNAEIRELRRTWYYSIS